jgi:hypothetical protein
LLREAQRRIAADRGLMACATRIFNHDLRPSEVFTPAFSLTTVAQALRRGRGRRRAILREAGTVALTDARRRRSAPRRSRTDFLLGA